MIRTQTDLARPPPRSDTLYTARWLLWDTSSVHDYRLIRSHVQNPRATFRFRPWLVAHGLTCSVSPCQTFEGWIGLLLQVALVIVIISCLKCVPNYGGRKSNNKKSDSKFPVRDHRMFMQVPGSISEQPSGHFQCYAAKVYLVLVCRTDYGRGTSWHWSCAQVFSSNVYAQVCIDMTWSTEAGSFRKYN